MNQPTPTPAYPFYTIIMNTGYEPRTRVESAYAYLSPQHKIEIELFEGMELMRIDQPIFGEIFQPRWTPTEQHEWFEELATKKQFDAAMKQFNAATKRALAKQPR